MGAAAPAESSPPVAAAQPRAMAMPKREMMKSMSAPPEMRSMAELAPETAPPVAAERPLTSEAPPRPELSNETPGRTVLDKGYHQVTVFYGTDRAPTETLVLSGLTAVGWFRFTAVAAGLTILLALVSLRYSQRRILTAASVCGLLITVTLGVITLRAQASPTAAELVEKRRYGNQRGNLETGVCEVSIPNRHVEGELERPSFLHFQWSQNPLKHVVVLSTQRQETEPFFKALKERVKQAPRKEAFVFVHGYNVSFESAARRTAQIAFDLKFEGAPVFFSWPSQGGLLGYTIDENNVVWSVPHLKQFLLEVSQRSGAESIHLVAHSMGNRALTTALREMFYELDATCPKFNEVVLTAPDIDADVFRRDLAPAIVKTARRVTLYASSNDEALQLSKRVHGYARAGESGEQLVVVPGMDTIDVSAVDTSFLGHSYYGNNRTVLGDLLDLLTTEKPPEQRKSLRAVRLGQLRYWVFVR